MRALVMILCGAVFVLAQYIEATSPQWSVAETNGPVAFSISADRSQVKVKCVSCGNPGTYEVWVDGKRYESLQGISISLVSPVIASVSSNSVLEVRKASAGHTVAMVVVDTLLTVAER